MLCLGCDYSLETLKFGCVYGYTGYLTQWRHTATISLTLSHCRSFSASTSCRSGWGSICCSVVCHGPPTSPSTWHRTFMATMTAAAYWDAPSSATYVLLWSSLWLLSVLRSKSDFHLWIIYARPVCVSCQKWSTIKPLISWWFYFVTCIGVDLTAVTGILGDPWAGGVLSKKSGRKLLTAGKMWFSTSFSLGSG